MYIENDTEWEEYFSDFIGVSRLSEDMIEIRLLVSKQKAPYIRTKPIHQTQKHIKNDGSGLEVSITVIPNYELESIILSHGESVTVLSPEYFRNKIIERIRKSLEQYEYLALASTDYLSKK